MRIFYNFFTFITLFIKIYYTLLNYQIILQQLLNNLKIQNYFNMKLYNPKAKVFVLFKNFELKIKQPVLINIDQDE